MRTSIAAADSTSSSPRDPWLEVRRGRTRAPRRDILGRRFLIGAGSNCQLQLGGGDVPILHSILLVEEDGAHIDAVVALPQLFVNGRPQRSADLHDGDVFSIGKFEFEVHVPRPTAASQAAPRRELPVPQTADDLEGLSASELVALIETEEQLVADDDQGRRHGAAALLDAVRQLANSQAVRQTAETTPERGTAPGFLLSFQPVEASAAAPATEPATTEPSLPLTTRRAS